MIVLYGVNFFTIEEVAEKTGYQKTTIYNFCCEKIISPPIQGLAGSAYPSQGLYRESVFEELKKYHELKISGMKKRDIIEHLRLERASNESELQILEAGRQA